MNSLEMSVPSPPLGISSSLTALRRISRTSSSILRPCRLARRCKRVFTAFSRFRTTSCPTIHLPSIKSDIMLSYHLAASQWHRGIRTAGHSVLGFPTHNPTHRLTCLVRLPRTLVVPVVLQVVAPRMNDREAAGAARLRVTRRAWRGADALPGAQERPPVARAGAIGTAAMLESSLLRSSSTRNAWS
jgi:hypothetical protein